MDECGGWGFDEYWEDIVKQADEVGGYYYSRMLIGQLAHGLRTGEPGALSSIAVREFLAEVLEEALRVKNPGEAGKALKINKPTKLPGSPLDELKAKFILWYCKQSEHEKLTNEQIRKWRLQNIRGNYLCCDRTFFTWKKEAEEEWSNEISAYHMFKDVMNTSS